MSKKPTVVVVGGGFGGLSAVRALRKADVDVVLIDRHTYNTFQPLLYQVATATLNPGDVTWFLRAVREHNPAVRFVNGDVVGMDHDRREVLLDGGDTIAYDYLVIATGVTANYFGIPGAAENSFPLYTRSQALKLRDAIFTNIEYAAARRPNDDLRIVVVGAGPTGVETAGALAEMRNVDMAVTYPELDPKRVHVTLVEMAPTVLGAFHEDSRNYVRKSLEKRGVDLRLSTKVHEVRKDGVVIGDDKELLPAGIVVWGSGVTAPQIVGKWGVPQGRGGRIEIDAHLRVKGLANVYAVGDIAVGEGDLALPQLAQPALQGGKYVAKEIAALVKGEAQEKPFSYKDKGILATVGRSSAVSEATHMPRLRGLPAWAIWTGVHVFTLLGNRNRAAAMVNLGSRYLFWRKGHNAIVGETPIARSQRRPENPRPEAVAADEVEGQAHPQD
ncbi:NAD(P)/FAD-dependent oxidoreductase [Calidifontibacter terrae]